MTRDRTADVLLFRGEVGRLWEGPPTIAWSWRDDPLEIATPAAVASCFGFVLAGATTVETPADRYSLRPGQFFCLPAPLRLTGGSGLVVEHRGLQPLPLLGGPLEPTGRLRYISGCTDTLLIAPLKFGLPCLNALYFPPHTEQQSHTHPSVRIGIVAGGQGTCLLPGRQLPLRPGSIFVIAPHAEHSFATADDELVIVAYHPDSDYGPRDEDHPMINRTLVDGVSLGGRRREGGG